MSVTCDFVLGTRGLRKVSTKAETEMPFFLISQEFLISSNLKC